MIYEIEVSPLVSPPTSVFAIEGPNTPEAAIEAVEIAKRLYIDDVSDKDYPLGVDDLDARELTNFERLDGEEFYDVDYVIPA